MPRRRQMLASIIATVAMAPTAQAAEASWLVGYWLDCDGKAAAESWIDAGSDTLLGVGLTRGRSRTSFEFMRIAKGADGALTFFASPNGAAPPTAFRLVRAEGQSLTFENPDHDFPQRVIYRRDGDRLHGRIEGTMNGKAVASDWTYRTAAPNTACPAS